MWKRVLICLCNLNGSNQKENGKNHITDQGAQTEHMPNISQCLRHLLCIPGWILSEAS